MILCARRQDFARPATGPGRRGQGLDEFDIGARLKELRVQAGLSQRQLAEASGVPHGQISMVETNRSSPSVASLRRILGGLSLSMSEFFEPDAPASQAVFFRPGEMRDLTARLHAALDDPRGRIVIRQVGDARAHGLQILHERYEPGADTGDQMLEHPAHEGGIVIAGEIEVTVGEETELLKAGDGFLFDSRRPHRFRNVGDRAAEVVSACTPPYL